jgi:hypothetical protein
MANRRMFSLTIVDTDIFLDMPSTTQNLYFHLGMRADDDGFVGNPKKITRTINSSDDDLKLLIAKGFIEILGGGIVFVSHWKENNDIRWDRYKPSKYQSLKPDYDFNKKMLPVGSTNGSTQVSIGKDRLGKFNNKTSKLSFSGQQVIYNFGKYQVWSGGKFVDLDPKYYKDIKEE